jgi:hypothetical protein
MRGWASRLSRLGVHHRFGIGHSGVPCSHWAPGIVQAERNRHLPISQINCPDEQVVPDPALLLPRAIAEGSIQTRLKSSAPRVSTSFTKLYKMKHSRSFCHSSVGGGTRQRVPSQEDRDSICKRSAVPSRDSKTASSAFEPSLIAASLRSGSARPSVRRRYLKATICSKIQE